MNENVSLTAKQERLLSALVQGSTIVDAAKSCQIAERTAHRWLRDEAFQQAYKQARKEAFEKALAMLMTGTGTALKVLLEAMKDKNSPYAVRVRAAQIWLEQAIAVHKNAELEERIAELEARLK